MTNIQNNQIPLGYKQTDMGVIPEDWSYSDFGECIFDFRGGASLKPSDFTATGVKVLPKSGITKGGILQIDETDQQFCTEEYAEKNQKSLVDKNYTIIVLRDLVPSGPNIGLMVRIPEKNRYLLAQGVYGFKVIPSKASSSFLIHLSNSDEYRRLMRQILVGSTQVHIRNSTIKQTKIPLPSRVEEQEAIAEVLLDTDSIIAKLAQTIQKKRNFKKGAIQELLTGKRRLTGFEKISGYKATDIGKIPNDWELNSYSDCFNFLSTATYSRAELNDQESVMYIHYGDIHTKFNNFLDIEHRVLPKICNHKAKNYSLLQSGDLIMADASEDYQGICKSIELINRSGKRVIAGLHTFALRNKNNLLANGFKGYLHENPIISSQFQMLATGMKVFGVSKGNLKKILIPTPSTPEQTAIAQVLLDMNTEIESLEKQKAKYIALKQGMMKQLLTGKIRLIKD